ncbi:MAG: manganese catalase family protein [Oscillospiraceae bacterium]|nr:manganese catalase family protein [Oscillospiraceae bacterium]
MYRGPDGELSAALRYLNQRYVMPYAEVKGLLTDIGISVTKLHPYFIIQIKQPALV